MKADVGKAKGKAGKAKLASETPGEPPSGKADGKTYQKMLADLQVEVAHLQAWVKTTGARIVIVFEGRDAAGKGGVIKRLVERVSPRIFRVVALPAPTDREKTQMFAQRYFAHMPAAGEVIIFDRSWYNRAGVERVLGFCTEEDAERFLTQTPAFERTLVENGIILLKYFLDVSEKEQERRFNQRIDDPLRQWKLSPMDVESYRRWWDFTRVYDEMIHRTDTPHAPWWIVPSDDKKRARVSCIAHLLSQIPYERVPFKKPKMGKRQKRPDDYVAPATARNIIPQVI